MKDLEAVIFKHDKDTESGMLDENVALFLDSCLQALIDNTTGNNHFLNRGSVKDKVPKDYVCDFCGKTRREVHKLINGKKVFICNECIGQCNDILNRESS